MAGAPSTTEVEQWLARIDDVSAAVKEILEEDPQKTEMLRLEREQQRREQQAALLRAKEKHRRERYDTRYYTKYEKDEVIEAMLRAVDDPGQQKRTVSHEKEKINSLRDGNNTHLCYSRAERVSLEEAERLKSEAAKAVQANNWEKALQCYTNALQLHVVDQKLVTILHNNRALVYNKLRKYDDAVTDSTFVLQREPNNVKALLRRATALRALYKPIEALNDVSAALRLEPHNSEALQQRTALQRVEQEVEASTAFTGTKGVKTAPSACATRLQTALQQLSTASEQLCTAPCESIEAASHTKSVITDTLQTCCEVLKEEGRGAAAHFAICGGVKLVLRLALLGDEKKDALGWLIIPCLPVITQVFLKCEVAIEEVTEHEMERHIIHTIENLATPQELQKIENKQSNGTQIRLNCLSALAAPYGEKIVTALTSQHTMLLHTLWKYIQRRNNAETIQQSSVPDRCQGDIHAFVKFLETLVRLLHRYRLRTTGDAEMQMAAMTLLRRQLVEPIEGEDQMPLVVRATMCALSSNSPRTLQYHGAALALALTVLCTSSSPMSLADANVVSALLAPTFTSMLHRILTVLLSSSNEQYSQEDSLLEALYSLVYNLLLQAPSDETYAMQWHKPEPRSLAVQSLDLLCAQLTSAKLLKPMYAKLLAFVSKSSRAVCRGTKTLYSQFLERVDGLWRCAAIVADVISTCNANEEDRVTRENNCKHDHDLRYGCAWECLEHITTLLAFLHKQRVSVLKCSSKSNHLLILLRVIDAARPPCSDGINGLAASANLMPVAIDIGMNIASSTAQIIAMGNAALLLTAAVDLILQATGVPDSDCVAPRAYLEGWLVENQAMDIILHAVRSTRTSLMLLRHEQADQSRTALPSVQTQLQRWEAHCLIAQQNLAIAITKLCIVSNMQRERLRELNGFATLAALQRQ